MSEKPKKSKKRIPQWQFLIAWIGGQYAAFFGTVLLGFLFMIPLNLMGFTLGQFPLILQSLIAGTVLGWFSGWVQQWSIRKHFGHDVKGWRSISAILTGLVFAIVMPPAIFFAGNFPALFEDGTTLTLFISLLFMALFGASGIGQAFLLRKHVKQSWLFFLSTLVGGLIYALPVFGNASTILAQIAQYSVTAFTILWLFQMSGAMDAMQSQDDAIERLSDAESDEEDDYYSREEEQSRRGRLFKGLWGFLRRGFAI